MQNLAIPFTLIKIIPTYPIHLFKHSYLSRGVFGFEIEYASIGMANHFCYFYKPACLSFQSLFSLYTEAFNTSIAFVHII